MSNFLTDIIDADLESGRHDRVATRFPPEPNGYLHIGHAKSICLNFGLAERYRGTCNLRFDDTNPEAEEDEFVRSIQADVRWLGFEWGERLFFASDFFERMYECAEKLVRDGKAYVDSLDAEQISAHRGSLTEAGRPSPDRDRPVSENLDLLRRMRAGEFPDGAYTLRARIDLASPNMKMRDPLLYRIRHAHHHRTGDDWCIYPMYDYAHPLEDAFEGITHSICTLEFENNRELYDWVIEHTGVEWVPRQYEFARLALNYTVLSKRKLVQLVREGHVAGWDDPRMPTVAGMRRGGVPAEAVRAFAEAVGVTKNNTIVDVGRFEHILRDTLNHEAPRVMCVVDPLEVEITDYPEGQVEQLEASYWPHDVPKEGTRPVPFSRRLYIERDDFREAPPKGYYRLAPGREVRLRYGYVVRCDEVVKDEAGNVVKLRCSHDPDTRGGKAPEGRKVKGTIHWVSAEGAQPCEVRIYDRLFSAEKPGAERDYLEDLNPESLVLRQAFVEPSVAADDPETRYQFERLGYFWRDPVDSKDGVLVFNRIVPLRDSWARRTTAQAPETVAEAPASKRADTRPTKRTAAEVRAEARARDPKLAARLDALVARGVGAEEADLLTASHELADFVEATLAAHDAPESVSRWAANELLREIKDTPVTELPFGGADFAALVVLADGDVVSATAAKQVFAEMLQGGGKPDAIVERLGLRQVSDAGALEAVVDAVLAENAGQVERYREGKTSLLGFFVGQVMRRQGQANPQLVRELLQKKL